MYNLGDMLANLDMYLRKHRSTWLVRVISRCSAPPSCRFLRRHNCGSHGCIKRATPPQNVWDNMCICIDIVIYIYNYIIYTLEVQCWCLPTHFTNVEVYLRICVMSMFTHQCRCAANLSTFCTAAGSLSWTCFISQTHAISLWITFDTEFPIGCCFVFTQRYIYVCMRAGVLP